MVLEKFDINQLKEETQKLIKELLRLNKLKRNSQLIYKMYQYNVGQTLPNSIVENMDEFILLELKKSD